MEAQGKSGPRTSEELKEAQSGCRMLTKWPIKRPHHAGHGGGAWISDFSIYTSESHDEAYISIRNVLLCGSLVGIRGKDTGG